MKLGLIVLPDSNEELMAAIEALKLTGVTVLNTSETSGKKDTVEDEFDDGFGEPESEELKVPTAEELKTILTKLRDDKGADIIKEILTSFGAKNLKTLEKSDWPAVYAAAQEAMKDGDDGFGDDLDDGGFGDLDDGADDTPLDPEVIKGLCQAYAKKNGKEKAIEVLKKAGLNSVRGIKSASDSALATIYKIVKCME